MRNETFHIGGAAAATSLTTYVLETYRTGDLRPLVIVCPGGGWLDCSPYEGEPVALAFNRVGYHAAVLVYSNATSNPGHSAFPQPLRDLADAILLVRAHAEEWHVNPERIVTLGFSAGGHLCASYGNLWNTSLLGEHGTPEERRPNTVVLGYAALDLTRMFQDSADEGAAEGELDLQQITGKREHARYTDLMRRSKRALLGESPTPETVRLASPLPGIGPDTPPTFLWTTFADGVVDPTQDLAYAQALHAADIPCELHVFAEGEHGLALADRTCARKPRHIDGHVAHWAELAVEWLDSLV